MNQEQPAHSGYLLFPPQGKLTSKAWQQKYCLLFDSSSLGIERLEVYERENDYPKQTPSRLYTLESCIKICCQDKTTFAIITKSWCFNFATRNTMELSEWISALQEVAFKSKVPLQPPPPREMSILEDNDLYSSSNEGVFSVKLEQTDASHRCVLEPKVYTLMFTTNCTQLKDNKTSKVLFTWPYQYIRRYGFNTDVFWFEAGRKCNSGEGLFNLKHANPQKIFQCLWSKMNLIRQMLNSGESCSSAGVLDCGDNQFHAALSMEARSRSPIPPSPTGTTKLMDMDLAATKAAHYPDLAAPDHVVKPKPNKPPRKNLPPADKQIPVPEYELISSFDSNRTKTLNYDPIYIRTEAWKKLGVDDVKHIEYASNDDDELPEYISWQGPKASENSPATNCDTDEYYDKLNFFGSSKLNAAGSPYTQVSPAPTLNLVQPPSWNDYEEVQVRMESVRLADDSHLGYGMIRKQNRSNAPPEPLPKQELINAQTVLLSDNQVPHQIINDLKYAIISKPKQV